MPGATFRLYPGLYFQIAQVRLDCAVTLSQALAPVVPVLVTHRNTTRHWRIHLCSEALCKPRQTVQLSPPVVGGRQEAPGNASQKRLEAPAM